MADRGKDEQEQLTRIVSNTTSCKACDRDIAWADTVDGGKMPIDPRLQKRMVLEPNGKLDVRTVVYPHHASCPGGWQFANGKKRRRAIIKSETYTVQEWLGDDEEPTAIGQMEYDWATSAWRCFFYNQHPESHMGMRFSQTLGGIKDRRGALDWFGYARREEAHYLRMIADQIDERDQSVTRESAESVREFSDELRRIANRLHPLED